MKNWILLAVARLAIAGDVSECFTPSGHPLSGMTLPDISAIQASEKLEWFSASPKQVDAAPCRRSGPLTDDEVSKGIQNLIPPTDHKISKDVHGIHLQNQSAYLVGLLEKLLSPAETTAPAQKTFSSDCTTVRCAVSDPQVFGPQVGPRLLLMLGRYGFNGSQYSFNSSRQFKPDEIDLVLTALSDFPASVLPVMENKRLTHALPGQSAPNTLADAKIALYDAWNTYPPETRESTIVHEVGHAIAERYDLANSSSWLKMGGWPPPKDGKEYVEKSSNPNALVSNYAKQSFDEDFAESVRAYRFNPAILLKSPNREKYDFLKEAVFDGLEYTSPEKCDPSNSTAGKLAPQTVSAVASTLENPISFSRVVAQVEKKCASDLFDQLQRDPLISNNEIANMRCMKRTAMAEVASQTSVVQSLKYSEQSEKAVLDRVPSDTILPAQREKIAAAVREGLSASFTKFAQNLEKRAKTYFDMQRKMHKPAANFCSDYSISAYQQGAEMNPIYGNSETFLQAHATVLDGFAQQLCLDMHGGDKAIVPATPEEINAAIQKHFVNK